MSSWIWSCMGRNAFELISLQSVQKGQKLVVTDFKRHRLSTAITLWMQQASYLAKMLLRELIKIVFSEERKVVFWENNNIMSKWHETCSSVFRPKGWNASRNSWSLNNVFILQLCFTIFLPGFVEHPEQQPKTLPQVTKQHQFWGKGRPYSAPHSVLFHLPFPVSSLCFKIKCVKLLYG